MFKNKDIEFKKEVYREKRKLYLQAFDLWEKAVIREREEDSVDIMNWYQEVLDYPDEINNSTKISDFPELHPYLEKYI